jgi:hypothetical protein
MGDLSAVMPAMHPHVAGAAGTSHGDDYEIVDPYMACVMSAQAQLLMAVTLLKDDGARAKHVMETFQPVYPSKEAYFEAVNQLMSDRGLVTYTENGAEVQF